MSYTHTVTVSLSYDDAVARTREALAEHGFGVLTEIDIRATFTKKLGQEAADAHVTQSGAAAGSASTDTEEDGQ